ncbi:MAG: hypothetical protein ACXAD7_24340, partial [Candidatus Kariarchaeaceae archaeon]
LKLVILNNLYYSSLGWSILFYILLIGFFVNVYFGFGFMLLFVFPFFSLSLISILVTIKLKRRLNILLSTFYLIINLFALEEIHYSAIFHLFGSRLDLGGLYWLGVFILISSLLLTIIQLLSLLFNIELKKIYLNKEMYVKPAIIYHFPLLSFMSGVPLCTIMILYATA